jgi:hypothetical protein
MRGGRSTAPTEGTLTLRQVQAAMDNQKCKEPQGFEYSKNVGYS